MAARDFSTWQPIYWDDQVVGRQFQPSAIMTVAGRTINMKSIQYDVPRFADSTVGGGSQLTEDTNNGDVAIMYDYQFNGKQTLDEAQLEDSPADTVAAVSYEWLNSLHIGYDNACIGTSAARSGTATNYLPYNSIYYTVRHNDTNVGYTADTNYKAATIGTSGYTNLSTTLGLVENTKFFDPMNAVVIMHPAVKARVRNIVDSNGRPIFVESSGGFPGGGVQPMYSLFGIPVEFSFGAVVTSGGFIGNVGGGSTQGNKLVVFANKKHLVRGVRIQPEAQFINANINISALEHTVQHRARLGFVATVPQAFAVMEITD